MLRSRGNRVQKASESSDQQADSSVSGYGHGYAGYPAASPMTGVSRGNDDDDRYDGGKTNLPSRLGGAGGSLSGSGSGGPSSRGIRDRRVPAPKYGTRGILVSFSLILIVFLGGMTFHYRRGIVRATRELEALERRTKGATYRDAASREPDALDDNDDEDDGDGREDQAAAGDDIAEQLESLRRTQRSLASETSSLTAKINSINNNIKGMESQLEDMEKENSSYQLEAVNLKEKTQRNVDKANELKTTFQRSWAESGGKKIIPGKGTEDVETLEQLEDLVDRREEILWEKIDQLVERIERDSVRDAIMTFGNPPYYVKMTVEYPQADPEKDPSDWQRTQGTLVFELAPLDKMPHAVDFFLQQVHHKLWDGCAFVINAMHILQAGPHRHIKAGDYEANAVDLMDKFSKAELDKIAFQEYHDDYPHKKYTLGLAGRPGGPDFYINKIDNSVNHGPGGQDHHDLHEEADPCFGKVIQGKRVIEELSRVPVDHAKGGLFLETVIIVNAVIAYDEKFEEEAD
ncbi:hypothetical protein ACHAXS_008069 [Conticribra weissflogii]